MLIENPCLPLLLNCLVFFFPPDLLFLILLLLLLLLLHVISYLYHNNYIFFPTLSFDYPPLDPGLSLSIHITFFLLLV